MQESRRAPKNPLLRFFVRIHECYRKTVGREGAWYHIREERTKQNLECFQKTPADDVDLHLGVTSGSLAILSSMSTTEECGGHIRKPEIGLFQVLLSKKKMHYFIQSKVCTKFPDYFRMRMQNPHVNLSLSINFI